MAETAGCESRLLESAPEAPPAAPRRRRALPVAAAAGLAACAAGLAGWRARRGAAALTAADGEAAVQLSRRYEGSLPMPGYSEQHNGCEDTRDFPMPMWDEVHFFAVGDWGAPLDNHQTSFCAGWDCGMQYQVANAMRRRAYWAKPKYILHAGDAFYLSGIQMDCNAPPSAAWGKPASDFRYGWENFYGELAQIPWIGTMGNHDYGGYRMTAGWPQLIGYSFVNHNWIMPARWFNRKVQHKKFLVEVFVIDTNFYDSHPPWEDEEHNICSQHNPSWAHCRGNRGMSSVWNCKDWFAQTYGQSKRWMEEKVSKSVADWKIALTHFPCGYDGSFFRSLHERFGLDLLVTGHRHQQEFWHPDSPSQYIQSNMRSHDLGGLLCFVTGGGGGIKAEKWPGAPYGQDFIYYGFYDVAISKERMNVQLIDENGNTRGNYTLSARNLPVPLPPKPADVYHDGWACHDYEVGQSNEWCQSAVVYHGVEYFFNAGGGRCGKCWCCKRPVDAAKRWAPTDAAWRVEIPVKPSAVYADSWACHDLEAGQDLNWCRSAGTYLGMEYTLHEGGGKCGQCWCCKRPADPWLHWTPTEGAPAPQDVAGDWQCHAPSGDKTDAWCAKMGVDEDGVEYAYEKGGERCGGCDCCRRRAARTAWRCHDYVGIQTSAWCRDVGLLFGWEYRYDEAHGLCGGGCTCCKRPGDVAGIP